MIVIVLIQQLFVLNFNKVQVKITIQRIIRALTVEAVGQGIKISFKALKRTRRRS